MRVELKAAIVVNKKDNVATAIRELIKGSTVIVEIGDIVYEVVLENDVMFLHKFALCNINKGSKVIKYGQAIGEAIRGIRKGEHVHIHNICSLRG